MDRAAAVDRLRSVRVLAHLPEETLARLADAVVWREIDLKQTIVTHLERTDSVFFIVAGACRAKLTGAAGRVIALRRLPAGAHFGEIAILTGAPRTVDVIAEAGALLAECPRATFDELMEASPAFAQAVAASLARTVVSLTERVFEFATLEVRFRLYAELLRLAAGGRVTEAGTLVADAPTQDVMAATIGSQRTAINRELKQLERDGVIKQERRQLLIPDVEKLRNLLRRRSGATTSESIDWQFDAPEEDEKDES